MTRNIEVIYSTLRIILSSKAHNNYLIDSDVKGVHIESIECRKLEIEKLMADPDFFKSKESMESTKEYKEIHTAIEKLYSDWSSISDEIEQLTLNFDKKINDISSR